MNGAEREIASETFDEWRVTGNPGHGYPLYDFTWSPDRNPHLGDPEAGARGFVELITAHHADPWDAGPHLHHRRVTRTPWKKVTP